MSDSLLDWVGEIAEKWGFTSDEPEDGGACEPVRPPEVIAASSAAQTTTGETTDETVDEGGDFVEGYRENAEENDHGDHFSTFDEGSHPMQSPNLAEAGDFALRYAVGFLCANYPDPDDKLKSVEKLGQAGSKYLAAFRGMDKSKQFKDPTKSVILNAIATWVVKLANALDGCEQGELVVAFQGHGSDGSIIGVDDGEITSSRLLKLAKQATKYRVSITYILDACLSGAAVPEFQENAADQLDEEIEAKVAGAGGSSSSENHALAQALRDRMGHARELIRMSKQIGKISSAMDMLGSDMGDENREQDFDDARKANPKIIKRVEALRDQFDNSMDFGDDPALELWRIDDAIDEVLTALRAMPDAGAFDYQNDWLSPIGKFQDALSDGANRIMKIVKAELKALE